MQLAAHPIPVCLNVSDCPNRLEQKVIKTYQEKYKNDNESFFLLEDWF